MQFDDLAERRFVEGAAHHPAFVAMTPEIGLAEVLNPDQAFGRIVEINFGRPNFMPGQELRDLDVMPVLLPLEVVLNQNDRLVGRTANAVEFPVRSPFFDRRYPDRRFFKPRKMNPGLAEKQLCFCGPRCRCHCVRLRPRGGSGQYNYAGKLGKRFVRPAKELCPPKSLPRQPGNRLRSSKSRRAWRLDQFAHLWQRGSANQPAPSNRGLQCSSRMVRWAARYSSRDPMLNHFRSFKTTPPILPPCPIQSARIGI